MTRPRSVHFGINVFWNLLGQGSVLVLSFFLVPYLIRRLGLEAYALYGLMGVLAGYLSLLSFGAAGATTKFVSEYVGRKDLPGLGALLPVPLLLHIVGVGVGAALAFIFRDRLAIEFFHVSQGLRPDASWILGCSAVGAVFFSLTMFAQCAFNGLQLFAQANLISILQAGCMFAGAALLLYLGFGLRSIGVYFVAVQAALAAASLAGLLPHLPKFGSGGKLKPGEARRFVSYSFQGFFGQLAWSAVFQWDKLVIGYFTPLSELTYYLIPFNLMQRFWVLPGSIASTAYPMISELHGAGDKATLRKIYRQCGQLILWIVVPGYSFLFALCPQFLTLWLGAHFSDHAVWPLRWLLLGYALYAATAMPSMTAAGTDKPHYTMTWQYIQAGLCVVSWIVLVPRLGIVGGALGFFIAQALSGLPYARLVSQELFGMGFGEYVEGVLLRPLAAGVLLLALLWPVRTWATTWPSLLLIGAAGTLVYYCGGFWLLGAEERDTLERLIKGFWQATGRDH